jgi:murein DD-endopeptidase MepM/ murein hydrolase activator NlpD
VDTILGIHHVTAIAGDPHRNVDFYAESARVHAFLACLVLLFIQAGCAPPFLPTPHERYARALRNSALDRTALGRDWLTAADRAITAPSPVALPLDEEIAIPEAEAWARGYLLSVRRGQRLIVRVSLTPGDTTLVFADLYEALPDSSRPLQRLVSAAASPPTLDYEARRDGSLVMRLQCELLRAPRLSIRAETRPVLSFPVQHRDSRAVMSFFGEPRAGGRRMHQGIDIVAPRGTPALSATRGIVTSAGTNRLGGNVVWVLDPERNLVLYYAHLDRHEVRIGEYVQPGDTVGLVGNTGNAEHTVPHLHFGIYARGEGAVDPYPFVGYRSPARSRRRSRRS